MNTYTKIDDILKRDENGTKKLIGGEKCKRVLIERLDEEEMIFHDCKIRLCEDAIVIEDYTGIHWVSKGYIKYFYIDEEESNG